MSKHTGNRALLASLLTLCVTLIGCQRGEESLTGQSAGHMVAEWGVVLPVEEQEKLPAYCAPPSPPGLRGQWAPSRAEIDSLERSLPSVLGKALARVIVEKGETLPRPADYYRQYAGFYRDGRRVVYICGLHRTLVEMTERTTEPQTWKRRAFGGDDLGFWIFGALYDVDKREFGPVQFQGTFSGPVRSRWF